MTTDTGEKVEAAGLVIDPDTERAAAEYEAKRAELVSKRDELAAEHAIMALEVRQAKELDDLDARHTVEADELGTITALDFRAWINPSIVLTDLVADLVTKATAEGAGSAGIGRVIAQDFYHSFPEVDKARSFWLSLFDDVVQDHAEGDGGGV